MRFLNNMTVRVVWADYIKAWAIILIVLFHSGLITNIITVPLLASGVPLFFVVNGALVLQKERKISYFVSKLSKILFLFLFWASLSSICTMILSGDKISFFAIVENALSLRMGYSHIFWFLCTLFALYAIYPAVQASIKNRQTLWFLIILSFLLSSRLFGYRVPTFNIPNIFSGWNSYSVFYALCGYLIITTEKEKKIKAKTLFLVIVVFYLSQLLMFSNLHIWNDLFIRHTPKDLDSAVFSVYSSPLIMCMVVFIVLLIKRINPVQNKIVSIISSNTLGIYVLHGIIMRLLRAHISVSSIFFGDAIMFIISFILSLGLSYVMQKNKVTRFIITM